MKKLNIAQIAPLWYPVPPLKYGGIEKIVSYLTEGLVKKGHSVTLFASGNSRTKAKLMATKKIGLAQEGVSWNDGNWPLEHLNFAFRNINKGKFDIVHSHAGLKTMFFEAFSKAPVAQTFHNPLDSPPANIPPSLQILEKRKNEMKAIFISKSQRDLCPIKIKSSFVIYNGIDENVFKFLATPKDYFFWAGRIEKNKGVEHAIMAARKADVKLLMAGKIDPLKQDYFNQKVKPYLNQKIKFLGELPFSKLVKLYQGALGFLYPIEWNEPFGLVMVEAMACGAPVIAFDNGSVKEVVKNNKTGFVVPFKNHQGKTNIKGLIEAIKNIGRISRQDCRAWVEQEFTLQKMVDNYEALYYKLLCAKNLRS